MPGKLRALHAAADVDATTAESRAAALQYVRLVTGMVRSHPDDAKEFEKLVLDIARATQSLQEMAQARREGGAVRIQSAG